MNIFYKKIIKKILLKNVKISVAESCTGGRISNELIKFPGASKFFLSGVIAYSNYSKIKILKVSKSKLFKYGAVSKEIANEMSRNLLKISKADICISTTGIAGPTGKTKNKSVGLIYIGMSTKKNTFVYKKIFKGNRISIQKKATQYALNLLYKKL